MNSLSLYIHIPFCIKKCDYCDFYSVPIFMQRDAALKKPHKLIKLFLKTLICDIYEQTEFFKVDNIPTVYIGGGTPSLLESGIKYLLDALKKIPGFAPLEITVEANPESVTEDFLSFCKEKGVTRLSLGVQTFNEDSRKAVNRATEISDIEKALSLASRLFPNSLSTDLITGLPYHTKKIVLEDIKKLMDFDPAHISVYSLTLDKKTPLYKNIKTKKTVLPLTEEADDMWLAARDALLNRGFCHYEVSNFSRKGAECLHNIRYWQMQGWLGTGPSASGTIIDDTQKTAVRYTHNADIISFLNKKKRKIVKEEISNKDLIKEIILMGYRYCKGPDPKWEIEKFIPASLEKWKDKDKMLFLNSFLTDAFEEISN